MARSYRTHPFHGITIAESDKPFKREVSRLVRSAAKRRIAKTEDFDALVLPVRNELRQQWDAPKDGKTRRDCARSLEPEPNPFPLNSLKPMQGLMEHAAV